MRYLILFTLICTTSLPWAVSDERYDSAFANNSQRETVFDPTFCLDGEIMQQLLQGFGSMIFVDKVSGLVLNCEARVIRETIVGDSGVIDIELECECVDPEGDGTAPDQLRGHWSVALDF